MGERGLAPMTAQTDARPLRLGNATGLTCRECGAAAELGPHYACPECFGPLEVGYDLPRLTRADIEAGPQNIWRYAALLPVPADIASRPTTEPGFTRLTQADGLAAELGLRRLWIKDDRGNPTHSFKDRVVAVALAAATELGFKVLACPSTGNLANAVAAAGARRPRAAEDHHHLGVRRDVRHRGRYLRRRQPARLRAGRRARGLGLRQR